MRIIASFALALALAQDAALAQGPVADCASGDAERALAGCTRIIEDKGASAEDRLRAHERRGTIVLINRRGLEDIEKAIADFSAAIRIEPGRAFSLYGRGMARLMAGDAAGQNEMEAAIMLQRDIGEEFRKRSVR
jgi:hypothetical protein